MAKSLCWIVSVLYLLVYLLIACLRMGYAYELEWMEGGVLDHVLRLKEGSPLYIAPSLSFTPFIYPSLYYRLSVWAMALLAEGLMPLRLISFLSSLATLGLLYYWVKKETLSAYHGWIAVGLFSSTFYLSGEWMDLARVDSLYTFFLVSGTFILVQRTSVGSAVLAAGLFFLAFLTKQSALSYIIGFSLLLVLKRDRRAWLFIPLAGGGVWIFVSLMNALSSGWFGYYLFTVPAHHPILYKMAIGFMPMYLPGTLSVLLGFALGELHGVRKGGEYLYIGLLYAGVSIVGVMHSGGFANQWLPMYAVLSLLGAMGIHRIENRLISLQITHWVPAVYILLLIQYTAVLYIPWKALPSAEEKRDMQRLHTFLSVHKGNVWMPGHNYLTRPYGNESTAHFMALMDIKRANLPEYQPVYEEIRQAITQKKWEWIILDYDYFEEISAPYYEKVPAPFVFETGFSRIGRDRQPLHFYRRIP